MVNTNFVREDRFVLNFEHALVRDRVQHLSLSNFVRLSLNGVPFFCVRGSVQFRLLKAYVD